MIWATPMAFWGLIPVLIYAVIKWRVRGRSAITFSSLRAMRDAGRSSRQSWMWLPDAAFLAAMVCLVLALARPQHDVTRTHEEHQGIAIEIVVDISSSMDMDIDDGEGRASRLDVAKRVVESFVAGNGEGLKGRPHDLIGVITFARYADTVCPLTLAHDAVVQLARDIEIGDRPNEDGTAYGDATALAAAHLSMYESLSSRHVGDWSGDIKSKIIVLLTDGENNSGQNSPLKAAALAKKWGIRIYSISLGEPAEDQQLKVGADSYDVPAGESVTEETLRSMADQTGGLFQTAHDFQSLQAVYAEIDKLERSDLKPVDVSEKGELFWIFAACALAGLCLDTGLRNTLLRRIP